jgi:hypothetical protein
MLIYACCVWQVFNCLNNDFVGRTIYILNCIDIYRFTPVSGCVGMGLSSLLYPGAYDAVKTASRIIIYIFNSGFVCTYSLACSINTELSSLKNKKFKIYMVLPTKSLFKQLKTCHTQHA